MTKMVIVMRRDLHMRKDEAIAQACHGAINVVLNTLDRDGLPWYITKQKIVIDGESALSDWFSNSCTKVYLYVDSDEVLLNLKKKADDAGILSFLVQDDIATEFHGMGTYTCIVFEPLDSAVIDPITGNLPLC